MMDEVNKKCKKKKMVALKEWKRASRSFSPARRGARNGVGALGETETECLVDEVRRRGGAASPSRATGAANAPALAGTEGREIVGHCDAPRSVTR